MNLDFVNDIDIENVKRIKGGFEWFYLNLEYFKRYYMGKYVVIKDQKVIDCDKSLDILLERLQIRDFTDSIVIEFVYP
jgi:hypothetical protein